MSSPWAASEWKVPLTGGGSLRQVEEGIRARPTVLHRGPFVHIPKFVTPPLFSLYAIPFLCSCCQSCPLTLLCTHTHTYKHTSNCCPPFFYCRQGSLIFSREEKHVVNSAALSPGLWQGLSVMEPQIQTGSPRSGTSCCCVSCICGNSAQMFGCILMLWCSCESWYRFSPFARWCIKV